MWHVALVAGAFSAQNAKLITTCTTETIEGVMIPNHKDKQNGKYIHYWLDHRKYAFALDEKSFILLAQIFMSFYLYSPQVLRIVHAAPQQAAWGH